MRAQPILKVPSVSETGPGFPLWIGGRWCVWAGTIWVNNYRVFGHKLPFGGYGQSGIGREMDTAALDAYTELKSVWIDTGNKVEFEAGPAKDPRGQ